MPVLKGKWVSYFQGVGIKALIRQCFGRGFFYVYLNQFDKGDEDD